MARASRITRERRRVRLPELHAIALGIGELRKAAVGVLLSVRLDVDAGGAQPRDHAGMVAACDPGGLNQQVITPSARVGVVLLEG